MPRDQSSYCKAMRERRKAQGLCPYCGLRPPVPSRVRCGPCLRYNAKCALADRVRKRQSGQCIHCPTGSPENCVGGTAMCYLHSVCMRRTNREYRKRLREKKKSLANALDEALVND